MDAADAATPGSLRTINGSSPAWFAFALVTAVVLVVMGATGKNRRQRRRNQGSTVAPGAVMLRCLLAAAAFTIWASLLPNSWPNSWELVQDMGAAYPLVLSVVASTFAFVSEALTRRYML